MTKYAVRFFSTGYSYGITITISSEPSGDINTFCIFTPYKAKKCTGPGATPAMCVLRFNGTFGAVAHRTQAIIALPSVHSNAFGRRNDPHIQHRVLSSLCVSPVVAEPTQLQISHPPQLPHLLYINRLLWSSKKVKLKLEYGIFLLKVIGPNIGQNIGQILPYKVA